MVAPGSIGGIESWLSLALGGEIECLKSARCDSIGVTSSRSRDGTNSGIRWVRSTGSSAKTRATASPLMAKQRVGVVAAKGWVTIAGPAASDASTMCSGMAECSAAPSGGGSCDGTSMPGAGGGKSVSSSKSDGRRVRRSGSGLACAWHTFSQRRRAKEVRILVRVACFPKWRRREPTLLPRGQTTATSLGLPTVTRGILVHSIFV
jgi:hypothetical protein